MSQILVIDVGNSRLKWALRGPRGWTARGAVANQDIGSLAVRDWQNLERPLRAVGVNVAGEAARVRVEGQLARWRLPIEWLSSGTQAGGVTNGYRHPSQLGADRWAALVAARRRATAANETSPHACVVVNAGTAVTIDALAADGAFRGGSILMGLRRSYFDIVAGPVAPDDIPLPSYWDAQVRMSFGDPAGDLEELRVALAQLACATAYVLGQQQLAARWRPQTVRLLDRALVGHRERADLLDLVAEELHAQRVLLRGREDVDDATPDRELAASLDEVDA